MAETDLTAVIDEFTETLGDDQAYRHPTAAETADALVGVRRLIRGADAEAMLGPLGFTVSGGVDLDSQRPYALARSETGPGRGAGLGYCLSIAVSRLRW